MTTKDFWESLRAFSVNGRGLFGDLFNNIEKFVEYNEARQEALNEPDEQQDDVLVLRLTDETHGIGVKYDLLAESAGENESKSDKASIIEEVKKEMPCQFSDGSFRICNKNTGRLQYRFGFNGDQISVYGNTKQECWDKRLNYMVHPPKREKKTIRFCEWAEKWLTTYKKNMVESAYYKSLVSNLKNHINPQIGAKDIKAISSLDLQEMLQKIKSDNVRTKCATLVGDCLRTAKLCGIISTNPYEGVKIKRYQQPELGALTHVQQQQLLAYIDKTIPGTKLNDFIRCLLFTGMRQSELNAISIENVDFENMQISIEGAYKRDTQQVGKTKTRRGKRIVPMAKPLADILTKYKDTAGRIFGFDSQDYTYHSISEIFKRLGMPFTAHILRHTFITNAYEFNFPQYLVQRWVGHAGFDEDNTYLALRKASEFCETEVTEYMRLLKKQTVLSQDKTQ